MSRKRQTNKEVIDRIEWAKKNFDKLPKVGNKINYGTKNLLPDTIEDRDVFVRTNYMIARDILDKLKSSAKTANMEVEDYLNNLLRNSFEQSELAKTPRK